MVGLGAMGSAVAMRLAERGLRVIGVDRFAPPHHHGSTHGDTRITRLAIGEGPEYVPSVRRSHELWRELERRTGTPLLHQTGGLVLGDPDNAFLGQTRAVASDHAIVHENLTHAELTRRFPMFHTDRDTEAYFEPEAGFVLPEAAVSTQLTLARRAGAQLLLDEAVASWASNDAGVTLTTAARSLEAHGLVLCAGAWITKLFPQRSGLFAIYPQVLHWFPILRGYDALRELPVFIWGTGNEKPEFTHGSALFYGFPAIDGPEGGVKVATETYDTAVDPDERFAPEADAAGRLYAAYIAPRFPWVGAEPLRTVSCLYTMTRDGGFLVDRHPQHANVMIVSACSGHGFKHSAAIGEAVAQVIADGRSELDLTPFRILGGS